MIIKFTIDGKTAYSQKGYTILKALSYLKIEVPNLCNYGAGNVNNINGLNENVGLSRIKDEKELRCKLCLVKVKRKNENFHSFKYACNEIVEREMEIISDDEELNKYRKTLLNSILHSHKKKCSDCGADYICLLKKYLDSYGIENHEIENKKEIVFGENNSAEKENDDKKNYIYLDFLDEIKEKVKTFGLPDYIKADYDRCINCGICENYKTINGYISMIADLCPTGVFYAERKKIKINGDKKYSTYYTASENSFCVGCNLLCEAEYIHNKNFIKDIRSASGKRYGLCDYGRKLDYYSNDILRYPLIRGVENDFEKAKEEYHKFISDFNERSYLAISSSAYPMEDLKAFNELASSLGIKKLDYKKNIMATNSNAIRENYSNINKYSIEKLKRELKYMDGNDIDYGSYDKFIILGDSLDDDDEKIISFSQKNKRNYILFSPTLTVLAYNAFVAFPISGLGEFHGEYIDRYGKSKEMTSFLNADKNRLNLRDLIKYLYL